MTLLEAHKLALKVLKQVMEEKLDENNVQLAQVRETMLKELTTGHIRRWIRDFIRSKVEGSHRGYRRVEYEIDMYTFMTSGVLVGVIRIHNLLIYFTEHRYD